MPKQLKQKRRTSDENEVAFQLVQRATQDPEPETPAAVPSSISEYMAQIGRKGGEIGGKRRLKTMSAEKRKEIATKAANMRWSKGKKKH